MGSNPVSPTKLIVKVYDCLIIGGGPAGLSACIYAARAGLKIACIEKEYFGGKLNKTTIVENYPGTMDIGGFDLGEIMVKQVDNLGVKRINSEVINIKKLKNKFSIITANKQKYSGKTILIATGTKEKTLDIPNMKEYYGKGVSYCAICDGNIYKGKRVIVIGGGNSAAEEAIYLSKIVDLVEIVHRRTEFRAEKMIMQKIKKIKNIRINTPYSPIEVKIKDKAITGLKVKNNETGKEKVIKASGIFVYIGLIPENYFLNSLNLKFSSGGFIEVNENMETSVKGVYAAGDIVNKNLRQITTATNDGTIAAISIKNYLNSIK